MNILIQDEKECWVCGKTFSNQNDLTIHHTIPKHLFPKKNVLVPICANCHKKVNHNDIKGMFAFAYKIDAMLRDLSVNASNFFDNVKTYMGHKPREEVKNVKDKVQS